MAFRLHRACFLLLLPIGGCEATAVLDYGAKDASVFDAHPPADASLQDLATEDQSLDSLQQPESALLDTQSNSDSSSDTPNIDPDAACVATHESATLVPRPVDILWMVDNSVSMKPAIDQVTAGLSAFAQTIASKNLDYRVIMLSLRSKTNPVLVSGSNRYGVCIPMPLAGDNDCGNGARFFHSSVDIRSTQPLEQFLGTLDQSEGYKDGQERGGEVWKAWLRPEATKTIVIVTDDNSRLSVLDFEHFAGGKNPSNSLTLPVGILDPSRAGLFDNYLFSALYGWGDPQNPSVKCSYADSSQPPSSGPTYTELVTKTGGVRAKICDGSAAWQPFFDAVAQAIQTAAKLSCVLPLPKPEAGTVDPGLVNVSISGNGSSLALPKVAGASACVADGGWYYDKEIDPTTVSLCPTSCDYAQAQVGPGKTGTIEVLLGCESIVIK